MPWPWLQLGSFTKVKVSTFPRDLLDPMQSRCGSLPGQQHATLAPGRAGRPAGQAGTWVVADYMCRCVWPTHATAHQPICFHQLCLIRLPALSFLSPHSRLHAQELDHAQAPHPQLQLTPVPQGERSWLL